MGVTDLLQLSEAGALVAALVLIVEMGRAAIARWVRPRSSDEIAEIRTDIAVIKTRLDANERDIGRALDAHSDRARLR